MDNQPTQKQWWAPVWKGLVMDPEAKHYRTIKSAVWLYLYLLLNANRRTGMLKRKVETVSRDMGISRGTTLRWLTILRTSGYIETANTGHSLTIQVTRWKAIVGVAKTEHQVSDISNTRYHKYPTPPRAPAGAIPIGIGAISGLGAAANETMMKIKLINERQTERGFTAIGASLQQELLAQELAKELNDAPGISLYRSYAAKYPEWLLRKVLSEVEALPPERITKGRGALFNYLVQLYDKGASQNPGH